MQKQSRTPDPAARGVQHTGHSDPRYLNESLNLCRHDDASTGCGDSSTPQEIQAEIYNFERHAFNDIPIRLIHVPTMKLVGREFVVEYLHNEVEAYLRCHGQLAEFKPSMFGKYAVLSHRWLPETEEVSKDDFESIMQGNNAQLLEMKKRGWEKLKHFCRLAADRGIDFTWADTCCIDKTSSVELDESIRSMFRWYRNSALCIIYLAQTHTLDDALTQDADNHDEWFSRGWTLQELLAPDCLKLFGADWNELMTSEVNDKKSSLVQFISNVTGISAEDLADFKPGPFSIDKRMCWAAKRRTKRVEDVAYSLMGIFGVSFSVAYGEGASSAFCRLIEAIILAGADGTVLNWAGPSAQHHVSRYIPVSPASYLGYLPIQPQRIPDLALTRNGMQLPLVLLPVKFDNDVPTYTIKFTELNGRMITHSSPLPNVRVAASEQAGWIYSVGLIQLEGSPSRWLSGPESSEKHLPIPLKSNGIFIRVSNLPMGYDDTLWKRIATNHIMIDIPSTRDFNVYLVNPNCVTLCL